MSEPPGTSQTKVSGKRLPNLYVRLLAEKLLDDTGELYDDSPETNLSRVVPELGFEHLEFVPSDKKLENVRGAVLHGKKQILINVELSDHEKRFVLAHEIGHIILHPDVDKVDFAHKSLDKPLPPSEIEANVFAYELLMPVAKFRKSVCETKGNLAQLSKTFLVDVKRIKKRLDFLNNMDRIATEKRQLSAEEL